MKNKSGLLLVLIAVLTGCFGGNKLPDKSLRLFQLKGYAQGTTYAISYIARDSVLTMAMATTLFANLDQSLSIYKKNSLISRFNESEKGLQIDGHLQAVVKKAMQVYKESWGAFDITIYPLVDAWGFANHARANQLPDSATIELLKSCVGSNLLQLKNSFLYKQKPCVKIDVNGIAQGYSVDHIALWLGSKGVKNYMVEVGGEIRTSGSNTLHNRDWTIAIEQPNEEEEDEPFRVLLRLKDAAVTTSGNYRKFYNSNGQHITHLIDPKTGYSIATDMISATVVAKDAITADAYDNVLMALGMQKALAFAEKHKNMEAYLIYKKPDGTVADTATKGFSKLLVPAK